MRKAYPLLFIRLSEADQSINSSDLCTIFISRARDYIRDRRHQRPMSRFPKESTSKKEHQAMSTIKTVLAALLIFGSASLVQAHASDAWMNRASQSFSGGGY